MKCATSTLHSQLALQPGIFMTTPKEPNFFSDEQQYARGPEWYIDLFAQADEHSICGESSTHYTKLPDHPETIPRLKAWKDRYKFIYVMRHPVERLISHYIHQWSVGVISCDINKAISQFPELINYSCYAMQLQPYFDVFGQDSVLPVFYETIRSDPQSELERIGAFLDYQGEMTWRQELAAQNVSSQRLRKFPGYKLLVESEPATRLRKLFIPQSIRDRLKNKLRMKERPKLSTDSHLYIESVFNKDLTKLSTWLGSNITCKDYPDMELQKTILRDHDQQRRKSFQS